MVGSSDVWKTTEYYADIAGAQSKPIDTNDDLFSIYSRDEKLAGESTESNGWTRPLIKPDEWVNWGAEDANNKPWQTNGSGNPLTAVYQTINGTGTITPFNTYEDKITQLSATLQGLRTTQSKEPQVGTAEETDMYVRQKYNYDNTWSENNKQNNYKLKITFGKGKKNEKLITFTGNGVLQSNGTYTGSTLQVFNIDAAAFTNGDANGISFRFDNIPDNASVVVNVVGSSSPITFNHGWRFWWNDTEIGNGYVIPSQNSKDPEEYERQKKQNELYTKAASAIMWNFANTEYLTIRGGKIDAGQATLEYVDSNKDFKENTQVAVQDDPAAALIGSILVPNGTFEDHVSTNGRVWVGKDLMLFSPTNIADTYPEAFNTEEGTASLINMDQERHNFPWSADATSSCSAIGWNKVAQQPEGTHTNLAETVWGVYTSLSDAQNQHNALVEVSDHRNNFNDAEGKFVVNRLKPNANYYIREKTAPDQYYLNSNIYLIPTGTGGQEAPFITISTVYDSSGQTITSNQLLNNNSIVNIPKSIPEVSWTKYDADDTQQSAIAGTTWKIERKDNGSYSEVATVTDCVAGMNDENSSGDCEKTEAKPIYDGDTEAGKFTIKGLNVGDYRISETQAAPGYELGNQQYYFTINYNAESVPLYTSENKTQQEQIAQEKLPNNRKKGMAQWKKISADDKNEQALAGSQWQITFTPQGSTQASEVKLTVKDVEIQCAANSWCSGIQKEGDVPGQFKLTQLPWGKYVLKETKAPDGYNLDETEHEFEITAQNVNETINLGNIENEPGVTLPGAGGDGFDMRMLVWGIGFVILGLIAAIYYCKTNKNEALLK